MVRRAVTPVLVFRGKRALFRKEGGDVRRFFGGRSTKFKRHDVVRLEEGAPYGSLQAGAVGVVIAVHPGDRPSYEVEFVDARGVTLDRLVVEEAHLSGVDDS